MLTPQLQELERRLRESMPVADYLFIAGKNSKNAEQLRAAIILAGEDRYAMMRSINGLIREHLEPMLSALDEHPEHIPMVREFAQDLFNPSIGVFLDAGLAEVVHDALNAHYQRKGDPENIAICNYWMGRVYRYYANPQAEAEVYEQTLGNLDQVRAFRSYEARDYAMRLVCNEGAALYDLKRYDECIDFIERMLELFDQLERDPEFLQPIDWVYSRYAMHTNATMALLSRHGEGLGDHEDVHRAMHHQQLAAQCETQITGEQATLSVARIMRCESEMMDGVITEREYLEQLGEMQRHINTIPTLEPKEEVLLNLYERMLKRVTASDEEGAGFDRVKMAGEVFDLVFTLCSRSRRSNEEASVVNYVREYLRMCDRLVSCEQIVSSVLNMTRQLYPFTYVHCLSVSRISTALAQALLRSKRSLFRELRETLGLPDSMEGDSELVYFIRLAALCHDVGKIGVTSTVSQTMRSLTDFEFAIIKQHPRAGFDILVSASVTAKFGYVALGHHRAYNGKFGYPPELPPEAAPYFLVTQIVAIADSIDAGSDYAGRWYSGTKTCEQLREEMRQGAGERYHPEVVKMLEIPEVFQEVEDVIGAQREQAFFAIYEGAPVDLFGRRTQG